MVQQSALRHEHGTQRREVLVELAVADVLGHADRRDRVELLAGELAIVLQPDLDPIGHTRLGDALAVRSSAWARLMVMPTTCASWCERGVDGHRAPAAADVEQPCTGLLVQPQLAADQLVLGRLGLVERGVGVR